MKYCVYLAVLCLFVVANSEGKSIPQKLYRNKRFLEGLLSVYEKSKKSIDNIASSISKKIGDTVNDLTDLAKDAASDKVNDLTHLAKDVAAEKVNDLTDLAKDAAADKVNDLKNLATDTLHRKKRWLGSIISAYDKTKDSLGDLATSINDKIGADTFDKLKDGAEGTISDVKDIMIHSANDVKDVATDKISDIRNVAVDKIVDPLEVATDKVNDLKDVAVDKVNDLKDVATDKVNDLKDVATDKVNDLKDVATDKVNDLKDVATDKVNNLEDVVTDIQNEAFESFKNIREAFLSKGKLATLDTLHMLEEVDNEFKETWNSMKTNVVESYEELSEETHNLLASLSDGDYMNEIKILLPYVADNIGCSIACKLVVIPVLNSACPSICKMAILFYRTLEKQSAEKSDVSSAHQNSSNVSQASNINDDNHNTNSEESDAITLSDNLISLPDSRMPSNETVFLPASPGNHIQPDLTSFMKSTLMNILQRFLLDVSRQHLSSKHNREYSSDHLEQDLSEGITSTNLVPAYSAKTWHQNGAKTTPVKHANRGMVIFANPRVANYWL